MPTVLLCYGTGEGQTRKVARRIADTLEARGLVVDVVDADERPTDLDVADFDAMLVGASVHRGRHQQSVRAFVRANRVALLARPSGFFQVSMFSALGEERREQAAGFAEDLFEATGWRPDLLGLFGGALRYSMYGFFERLLMKWWARRTTGDIDASRDYEYTDWDAVERFAEDFASFVERELGASGGTGADVGTEGDDRSPDAVVSAPPENELVEPAQ